jgi:F-type H+-transporting ATPase subunit epsilon
VRLRIATPTGVLPDRAAVEIVLETDHGSVGLLPRHIDFVAPLVPGILLYEDEAGGEHYVAVDQGTVVKCGPDVLVAVREAVEGEELGALRSAVRERFESVDDRERLSRTALAQLETRFLRALLEQRYGSERG